MSPDTAVHMLLGVEAWCGGILVVRRYMWKKPLLPPPPPPPKPKPRVRDAVHYNADFYKLTEEWKKQLDHMKWELEKQKKMQNHYGYRSPSR